MRIVLKVNKAADVCVSLSGGPVTFPQSRLPGTFRRSSGCGDEIMRLSSVVTSVKAAAAAGPLRGADGPGCRACTLPWREPREEPATSLRCDHTWFEPASQRTWSRPGLRTDLVVTPGRWLTPRLGSCSGRIAPLPGPDPIGRWGKSRATSRSPHHTRHTWPLLSRPGQPAQEPVADPVGGGASGRRPPATGRAAVCPASKRSMRRGAEGWVGPGVGVRVGTRKASAVSVSEHEKQGAA